MMSARFIILLFFFFAGSIGGFCQDEDMAVAVLTKDTLHDLTQYTLAINSMSNGIESSIGKTIDVIENFEDDLIYNFESRFINVTSESRWVIQLPFQTITDGLLKLESIDGDDIVVKELGIFQKRNGNSAHFSLGRKSTYIQVNLRKRVEYKLYLTIENEKNHSSIDPYVYLVPSDDFEEEQKSAFLSYGIFSGIIMVMLIIVLIFYFNTTESAFLQYAGYIFFFLLWSSFSSGPLREWCFDNLENWNPRYFFFLRSMGIPATLFYTRFMIEFSSLNAKVKVFEWIRRATLPVMIVLVILDWIVLSFSGFNFVYSNMVSIPVMLFFILFNVVMAYYLWRYTDLKYRRLIISAVTIFLIGVTASVIKVFQNDFKSIYAWEAHLASLIEICVFSFGIGLRARDHVQISKENTVIKGLLGEKETLLKEVHHRVKNNLQVISSLLGMQSLSIEDDQAKSAIQEGRSRVHSMSLIHQHLYKDDQTSGVPMEQYVQRLCKDLIVTYHIGEVDITFYEDVQPGLVLDVETVVPLGLIINELITNALKHAFKGRKNGLITIRLFEQAYELILEVRDDGVGFITKSDSKDSFGLRLVDSFKQKLKADVAIHGANGTLVTLSIKNYKSIN